MDKEAVVCLFSRSVVSDSETPWTVAHQASLSTRFPKQEYWSRLPFPSPVPSNPGIEPGSPECLLQVDSYTTEPLGKLGKEGVVYTHTYTGILLSH